MPKHYVAFTFHHTASCPKHLFTGSLLPASLKSGFWCLIYLGRPH
jgi:hypothetical protein